MAIRLSAFWAHLSARAAVVLRYIYFLDMDAVCVYLAVVLLKSYPHSYRTFPHSQSPTSRGKSSTFESSKLCNAFQQLADGVREYMVGVMKTRKLP